MIKSGKNPYDKYANGIYILHTNGELYTYNEWDIDNNNDSVGVAFIDDNARFVMSKIQGGSMKWDTNNKLINNIIVASTASMALADYFGELNTDEILQQNSSSNALAANYCRNTQGLFPDERKAYLGAYGELNIVFRYKTQVDDILTKIGAQPMITGEYLWSSTQNNSSYVWCNRWDRVYNTIGPKYVACRVRAFAPLIY